MEMEQIILEKNIACTMRDQVTLYADVYRPNKSGKFPVLLTRLPYGKDDPFFSHRYIDTNRLVQAGYIVIIQDVRGRFNSEGDFFPFQAEAEDGYDTVEWAASLPYANGQVGMFGLSYYGFTQLLAAKEQPPHLKALFPAQTLNNLQHNMVYQDGVVKLASMKTWILQSMVPDLLRRKYKHDPDILNKKMSLWAKEMDALASTYEQTLDDGWPLLNELGVAEEFFHIYQYEKNNPIWDKTSIRKDYEQIAYPAFHLAGWYDSLLQSTLENYQYMQGHKHAPQRLMIGPWTHGDFGSIQGERDFGLQASEHLLEGKEDLTNLHIRWFDRWLKEVETNVENEAAVKVFVMGINEWRDEAEWPLARTTYRPYYLHSEKSANSRFGDGILDIAKPNEETAFDTFIHDSRDLIPSTGGQTLYHGIETAGPRNQQNLEERHDILVYTSPVLNKELEVTGPIKVKLWVTSEAVETTFTAKLVDVFPDGRAINLTDGISREIMTTSAENKETSTLVEIDLWATSNMFLVGHAIRVEIASSNHPQFDPVQAYDMDGKKLTQIKQVLYQDVNRPSHIVLPIIEA